MTTETITVERTGVIHQAEGDAQRIDAYLPSGLPAKPRGQPAAFAQWRCAVRLGSAALRKGLRISRFISRV